MNFTVIDTRLITFGRGISVNRIEVKCNNCSGKFSMIRRLKLLDDNTSKIEYEFKYCPHCANKLEVKDNEKID